MVISYQEIGTADRTLRAYNILLKCIGKLVSGSIKRWVWFSLLEARLWRRGPCPQLEI